MSTINKINIENEIYDLEDTQAREELKNKANKDDIPSIEGLATEEFVEKSLSNIPSGSGEWKLIQEETGTHTQ